MRISRSLILGLGAFIFASFSSSSTYVLNSYGFGPGATSSSSTTYKLQGTLGQQTNASTSSVTKVGANGQIETEQLNVPPAPTLSNGSGTYYNKLNCIVNNSVDPSDATYSIAVSSNSFVTTYYVQADGSLNSSTVYQNYTTWGGASGVMIIGLTPSTTYEVKVNTKEGQFSNTEYGAYASAATVAPAMSFSVTPNTINFGSLLSGTVETSSNLTFGFSTNAAYGGSVYVSGLYGGLKSAIQNHLIAAQSTNLSSVSEGFGLQATGATESSGGPFTIASPYNGSGNNVGIESSTPAQILYSSSPIVSGSANVNLQAKATSPTTPASADYTETLTFIAAASF